MWIHPEDLSEESPVEGPSEPITLEMITKAISKMASGKAAGPSGIVAEMLKPVVEAGAVECVISLRTSSRRDAFQLTGRKASLSICTRAKEMLWIEATTGAWSWLSKCWRCWSVWWRNSSGKELRSMRCSVASCLAVALLMQFLLYVSYRRSTWLPTTTLHGLRRPGESIWSSSTGCHLVGNAQTRNWRVVGASGPVHVPGCEKQGKSRRWVQQGVWCWSGCSSGLCP